MFAVTPSKIALSVAAVAAFGTVANACVAMVSLTHSHPSAAGAATAGAKPGTAASARPGTVMNMPGMQVSSAATGPAGTGATFLVATFDAGNGSPAHGGQAVEVIRIEGDQASFGVWWQGIGAPTGNHVNVGGAGHNGAVQLPFFSTPVPDTLDAAVGTLTVSDSKVLDALKVNPAGYYASLDTAQYPGGALRGQLRPLGRPVDLSAFLHAGPLTALLDGTQAVQVDGGAVIGDRGGHAVSFVRAGRSTVDFAFTWSGIATPTYAHIHTGGIGADGPPALPLFAAPSGLPSTFTGVAGTVGGLDPDLVRQIASHPANFYVNLHTADFPGGAVRGQLFDAGHRDAAPTVTS